MHSEQQLTAGEGVNHLEVVRQRRQAFVDQIPIVDVHAVVGRDRLGAQPTVEATGELTMRCRL